jgi:tetratricopeptide (TPR) repeat protein
VDERDDTTALVAGRFAQDPNLLYLLAEAILVQGRPVEAQKLADQALAIAPDSKDSHRLMGFQLQDRGAFRWAEKEYRQAFEGLDMTNMISIFARGQLSEMLHDQGDDKAAVEVLRPMVVALRELENTGHQFDPRSNERIGPRIARYYFLQAQVAQAAGNIERAKDRYRKAIDYDESEPDSLINMSALDDDPEWQMEVKEKIDAYFQFYKPAVERFQEQIDFFKRNAQGRDVLGSDSSGMATYMNQYAWVVGNTYGDIDHAIEVSLLSLELRPGDGAFLDTLAHCYARKKDYAEAVEQQALALKQLPHSRQIRNAYTRFADLHEEHVGPLEREKLAVSPDTYFE